MPRKKIILAFLGVFLALILILIPIVFYYVSQRPIEVVNGSKYYSVEYNKSVDKKFREYLNDWNFWGENNVFLEIDGKRHTVKKIRIITTDTLQPYYHLKADEGTVLLSSISDNVDSNGTLTIKIYLNPEIVSQFSEEALRGLFFYTLGQRLYSMSHFEQKDQEKFDQVAAFSSDFWKDKQNDPFIISKN